MEDPNNEAGPKEPPPHEELGNPEKEEAKEHTEMRVAHTYGDRLKAFFAAGIAALSVNAAQPTESEAEPIHASPTTLVAADTADTQGAKTEMSEAEKEFSIMEKQAAWHTNRETARFISILHSYTSEAEQKPTYEKVQEAIDALTVILTSYPTEFNKYAKDDPALASAIQRLRETSQHNPLIHTKSEQIPYKTLNVVKRIRNDTRNLCFNIIQRILPEIIQGTMDDLSLSANDDAGYADSMLHTSVDIVADMAENDGYAAHMTKIAQKIDTIMPHIKARHDRGEKIPLGLLSSLVHSGNDDAARLVAEQIKDHADDPDLFSIRSPYFEIFSADRTRAVINDKLYADDPRLSAFGQGGRLVAKRALEDWGYSPKEFLSAWESVQEGDISEYLARTIGNTRRFSNIMMIARLDKELPGAMTTLAGERWGIRTPARYPTELLLEQARADMSGVETAEHIGAILTATESSNAVFDPNLPHNTFRRFDDVEAIYSQAKELGITTRIIEASTVPEAKRRLAGIKERTGLLLDFLDLRGHGGNGNIVLSSNHEDGKIYGAELIKITGGNGEMIMAKNAPIHVYSCEAGKPYTVAQNASYGIEGTITAPDRITSIEKISLVRKVDGQLAFITDYTPYALKSDASEAEAMTSTLYYRGGKLVGDGWGMIRMDETDILKTLDENTKSMPEEQHTGED